MSRPNTEALSRPFQNSRFRVEVETRACDRPGCEAEGQYRAPRGRDRLNEYYWFCLDHVREYNRAWNYYAGMNEAQIEAERRRDSTWHRPSWRFGSLGAGAQYGFRDDFGFFDEDTAARQGRRRQWERNRHGQGEPGRGDGEHDRALGELGLDPPVSFAAIKARYKELVKLLHPDANGGDRTHEDRLKTVNQAYATLRAAYR